MLYCSGSYQIVILRCALTKPIGISFVICSCHDVKKKNMCITSAGTGMIIGEEIILEGEVGVRVESDMAVTGTQRGIIIVVAGVAATVLMITGGVAGTGTHI
jgi:hypothetical protein